VTRDRPSYSVDTGYGRLKLYSTTTRLGDRGADLQNTRFLPSYWTEDVGASFYMPNGLEFRLAGTNITNSLAITEGNSRVLGNGIFSNVLLARPLFRGHLRGQRRHPLLARQGRSRPLTTYRAEVGREEIQDETGKWLGNDDGREWANPHSYRE
jgi:hypothetical protein